MRERDVEQGSEGVVEEQRSDADDGREREKEPDVMTVKELAMMLRIGRNATYAAIQRGEIAGVRKVGAVIRISRQAVGQWLAEGGRPANKRRNQ